MEGRALVSDSDLRSLERRLAASNDPADARALARARFRLNGDCGADLRVSWSRRCGNESQRVIERQKVGDSLRVLPPCPSCALRMGFPEGEKLVTYVGLYDNPKGNRACSRSLAEWLKEVPCRVMASDGEGHDGMAPRFTRVS